MLRRFEARGYRFITLDEAMADPAYQTKDTDVSKFGQSWLARWVRSLGMKVSSDISLWGKVNEVYARVMGDHRPARAVVPVKELHHGFQIEIAAIAAIGE